MSQDILEEINKKMEEMVEGRRYIIRQVGTLKVAVEDLIEKLGSGGASAEGGDVSGLTSLLEALNQEIMSLKESDASSELKNLLGEFKDALNEVKENTNTLKEKLSEGAPSTEVNVTPLIEKVDEVNEKLSTKIEEVTSKITQLNEQLSVLENVKTEIEKLSGLNDVVEKIDALSEKLSAIREEKSEETDEGVRSLLNKLVGIILDLKADMDKIDENMNFGLKVIENNIKEGLKGESYTPKIKDKTEAEKQLLEYLENGGDKVKIYDGLLDLLFFTVKENKFNEKIPKILELIKKVREEDENVIPDSLKQEILELM